MTEDNNVKQDSLLAKLAEATVRAAIQKDLIQWALA